MGDLPTPENTPQTGVSRLTPKQWLIRIIQGAIIGSGAILPGISGGVLCVSFGIYKPMMTLLSNPLKQLKKLILFFLPIAIGWLVGFLGFARIIDVLFSAAAVVTTWLFIGLIAGTFPSLIREAGKRGIPVVETDSTKLDALAESKAHQGILAFAFDKEYSSRYCRRSKKAVCWHYHTQKDFSAGAVKSSD